jgi:ribonuclease-3
MNEIEARLGYRFRSRKVLEEALRHASAAGNGNEGNSYQRLEFLGDAVLSLCIAEEMFRTMPDEGEGSLSKARSSIINNLNLFKVGERIGLTGALHTDPAVRGKGGGVTRKMVADAVEAVIGAIFIDGGYESAREFVLGQFMPERGGREMAAGFDPKSRLQEWCQANRLPLPRYRLKSATGPPHARTFEVEVTAGGRFEESGRGKTKKEAEMEAASKVLDALEGEQGELPR